MELEKKLTIYVAIGYFSLLLAILFMALGNEYMGLILITIPIAMVVYMTYLSIKKETSSS